MRLTFARRKMALFNQNKGFWLKSLVWVLVGFGVMVWDHTTTHLDGLRMRLHTGLSVLEHASAWPRHVQATWSAWHTRQQQLLHDNWVLRQRNLWLEVQQQHVGALTADIKRLRALLHAVPDEPSHWLVAQIMGWDPDPMVQQITLDRGAQAGVHKGQVVLDTAGVVGQVIDVSAHTSVVLQVTDASHAVPVADQRTGEQWIAQGTGRATMEGLYVPLTAQVQVGDRLVTSGLGGRFPTGYPVGRVVAVRRDPEQPFLHVAVEPVTSAHAVREVLLVGKGLRSPDAGARVS